MSRLRWILGGLLGFFALNAFGGAAYGLAGAEGIPREWLSGSPFSDYFIPSLILGVVVGGSLLVAAWAVLTRWANAVWFAIGASAVVLVWIAAQVSIIGYTSWMQPATAIYAVVILLLAALPIVAGRDRRLA